MDKCQLEEAGVILSGLFKSRENPTAFLQPANQTLDDVARPVSLAIKWYFATIIMVTLL